MKASAQNDGCSPTRRIMLLTSLALLLGPGPRAALGEITLMDNDEQDFGKIAPHAPAELSRWAFLIGRWRCEARILLASGEWQKFDATWVGRFILDGYVVADEYRMMSASGELIVLGVNLRTYDERRKVWNIRWLNALDGNWTILASQELGGIRFDGPSITYVFKEPVANHAYTRATYTPHSASHFTWRGEKSDDRKAWSEFMIVECYRTEG
jgi:hypothetical protein